MLKITIPGREFWDEEKEEFWFPFQNGNPNGTSRSSEKGIKRWRRQWIIYDA